MSGREKSWILDCISFCGTRVLHLACTSISIRFHPSPNHREGRSSQPQPTGGAGGPSWEKKGRPVRSDPYTEAQTTHPQERDLADFIVGPLQEVLLEHQKQSETTRNAHPRKLHLSIDMNSFNNSQILRMQL